MLLSLESHEGFHQQEQLSNEDAPSRFIGSLIFTFFPFFSQSQACQMLLQLVSQKVNVQSVIFVVIMFQFKVFFYLSFCCS